MDAHTASTCSAQNVRKPPMKPNLKQKITVCCAIISIALCAKVQSAPAQVKNGAEKIFYSARYYSPPGSGATSRMHLYSIATRGGAPQQLTSGRLNEDTPRLSPDGRTLAFTRTHDDYSSEICALDLVTKRVKIVLPAAKDTYIVALEWTPNGNTLAAEREGNSNSALYLTDFPAADQRRFSSLGDWAWRPNSAQMRISDNKGTRLLDVATGRETPLSPELADTIWLNHDECARVVTAPDANGQDDYNAQVKSVDIFGLNGQKLRSVALQKVQGIVKIGNDNAGMDGEAIEFDGRAMLMPIPRQSNALMLLANESTSSGANFAFTRFDAQSGQTRFLARGTHLRWSRDAQRFAVVDYHDTQPYDTLPNGHKRVVYTTRLLIGDGKSALRPLVSGLVLVFDCDWSR